MCSTDLLVDESCLQKMQRIVMKPLNSMQVAKATRETGDNVINRLSNSPEIAALAGRESDRYPSVNGLQAMTSL
ncbi:hypothetical protein ACQV5M_22080, partial [Leptospira sp. SA-E8]|uniref:hypothetical protein n=1 Tax=Leptospira sp. SA-E8 TaxID=3422259 RepID=UPI003EC035BB